MPIKNLVLGSIVVAAAVVGVSLGARADIVLKTDGHVSEGKVISQSASAIVFLKDGGDPAQPEHLDRAVVGRVVLTDEHGAWLSDGATHPATQPSEHWAVPPEPAAPAVSPTAPAGRTYYVIPLHGEVGSTVLASALEKSLADAALRKPTVVVLDINSPGGLVDESEKITKVLHHYNKQLRIIALTDQDLSAAAIFSLSVKEIYVKSTSTIGAATAFVPNHPDLSAKVEEKMQSAWRAVARNSAEEGGHEPLLAEAMIDNDVELHLETVSGKKVVKEGPGDSTLCRKGKILTLTSHEAVECGLAAGEADDVNELGTAIGFSGWTEIKGLSGPLADYLPQRAEAFKGPAQKIAADFVQNIQRAVESDPAEQVSRIVVNHSIGPIGPHIPQPRFGPTHIAPTPFGRPVRPGYNPPMAGQPQQGATVVTSVSRTHWKSRSLHCVLALEQSELNIAQLMSLCDAYGLEGSKDKLTETMTQISALRARIFDDRNKYGPGDGGAGSSVTVAPTTPTTPGGAPAQPSTHTREIVRGNTARGALPEGATKTEMLGGMGGGPFVEVSPTGSPVIGFRYVYGNWDKPVMRKCDPIFDRLAPGTPPEPMTVIARDGYVVGGILGECDQTNFVCVRVIFVRYRDGHPVPADTYQSDLIGTSANLPVHKLAGNGETVIGVFGRYGMNMAAMGLVLAAPATPGASAGLPPPQTSTPVAPTTPPPAPARVHHFPQVDVANALERLRGNSLPSQLSAASQLARAVPDDKDRSAVLSALRPFVKDGTDEHWSSFAVPFCRWSDAGETDSVKSFLATSDGLTGFDRKERSSSAICVALLRLDPNTAIQAINARVQNQLFRTHLIGDVRKLGEEDETAKPVADKVVNQLIHYTGAGTKITLD